jgi:hypothetical protein
MHIGTSSNEFAGVKLVVTDGDGNLLTKTSEDQDLRRLPFSAGDIGPPHVSPVLSWVPEESDGTAKHVRAQAHSCNAICAKEGRYCVDTHELDDNNRFTFRHGNGETKASAALHTKRVRCEETPDQVWNRTHIPDEERVQSSSCLCGRLVAQGIGVAMVASDGTTACDAACGEATGGPCVNIDELSYEREQEVASKIRESKAAGESATGSNAATIKSHLQGSTGRVPRCHQTGSKHCLCSTGKAVTVSTTAPPAPGHMNITKKSGQELQGQWVPGSEDDEVIPEVGAPGLRYHITNQTGAVGCLQSLHDSTTAATLLPALDVLVSSKGTFPGAGYSYGFAPVGCESAATTDAGGPNQWFLSGAKGVRYRSRSSGKCYSLASDCRTAWQVPTRRPPQRSPR